MSDDFDRGGYFTGMPMDLKPRWEGDALFEAAQSALPELRRWLHRNRRFRLVSVELHEGQPLRAYVQGPYEDFVLWWMPGRWERML